MEDTNVEDVAFLAEVTGFLAQCEGTGKVTVQETSSTDNDGLLLTSHQLLAETEELLASSKNPKDNEEHANSTPSRSTCSSVVKEAAKTRQVSAEERREIRNVQAAKRRQRYRQKLRDEKETLTQQASELSGMLTRLQVAKAELKVRQAGNLALGAWRAVATRQLERRLQAEQLQKQLRADVVGRSRMIDKMSALLQDSLQGGAQSERKLSWETVESSESALLATLSSELDDLYAQTDEVFQHTEYNAEIYNLTRKRHRGMLYFDSADRMELPCDYELACDAMSVIMLSEPDANLQLVNAQDVDDTITAKYAATYKLKEGGSARFVVYGAGKRYQEKDRLVYMWRSFTEGQDELDGLQSDETSWVIVRRWRKEEREDSSSASSSILESYTRMVPVGFGSTSARNEDIDRFVKILAESGEQEIKDMIGAMENLVINDQRS